MNKTKTNISVKTNTGSRRKVDIIAGDNGPYVSGDILDANATKQLIDNVAVTGDYNDLDNKPTIPNVAVINLEVEDLDMSTTPYTITNQDKISQICDLIETKTIVMGAASLDANHPIPGLIFYTLIPAYDGTDLTIVNLVAAAFSGYGVMSGAVADVTSRYVTSNT